MTKHSQDISLLTLCLWICCLSIILFSGCARDRSSENLSPEPQDLGTPPTLSSLTVSPNPTTAGKIVILTTNYIDPNADLHSGLAAVSINGENFSNIAFRSTYPSGILTLPWTIEHYTRQSDMTISLKIRDDAGNWSNVVSTVLSVR